jgi:hypothetical protein
MGDPFSQTVFVKKNQGGIHTRSHRSLLSLFLDKNVLLIINSISKVEIGGLFFRRISLSETQTIKPKPDHEKIVQTADVSPKKWKTISCEYR